MAGDDEQTGDAPTFEQPDFSMFEADGEEPATSAPGASSDYDGGEQPRGDGGSQPEAAGPPDEGNFIEGGAAAAVLEHLAVSIVDDKESVVVESRPERGQLRLYLHVAPSDMGRIIGRRGRTAQALRTLVRAAAAAEGQDTFVEIVD